MVITKGVATITIPVKLKYQLLTEKERLKVEEEKDQLTAAEKAEALRTLAANSPKEEVKKRLEFLKWRSPNKSDPQLLKAIEPWLKSDDAKIRAFSRTCNGLMVA